MTLNFHFVFCIYLYFVKIVILLYFAVCRYHLTQVLSLLFIRVECSCGISSILRATGEGGVGLTLLCLCSSQEDCIAADAVGHPHWLMYISHYLQSDLVAQGGPQQHLRDQYRQDFVLATGTSTICRIELSIQD